MLEFRFTTTHARFYTAQKLTAFFLFSYYHSPKRQCHFGQSQSGKDYSEPISSPTTLSLFCLRVYRLSQAESTKCFCHAISVLSQGLFFMSHFIDAFVPFITRSLQFSNCQITHQHRWRSSHIFQNLSQTTDSRLLVFLRFIWQLKHFLTLHHCFVFILLFASTVLRKPTKIRAFGCTRYAYLLLLSFILKHT